MKSWTSGSARCGLWMVAAAVILAKQQLRFQNTEKQGKFEANLQIQVVALVRDCFTNSSPCHQVVQQLTTNRQLKTRLGGRVKRRQPCFSIKLPPLPPKRYSWSNAFWGTSQDLFFLRWEIAIASLPGCKPHQTSEEVAQDYTVWMFTVDKVM